MLNESTKEESLKLCQSQRAGLEAAVLGQGIEMIIIEIEITEGEAAVEAEGGMNVIDTMRGREIIIGEAAVVA